MSLWVRIRIVGGSHYRPGRIYLQICHKFPRKKMFYGQIILYARFWALILNLSNNLIQYEFSKTSILLVCDFIKWSLLRKLINLYLNLYRSKIVNFSHRYTDTFFFWMISLRRMYWEEGMSGSLELFKLLRDRHELYRSVLIEFLILFVLIGTGTS